MKTIQSLPVIRLVRLFASLPALFSAPAFSAPAATGSAAEPVELPAYEVTAPRSTSPSATWREKLDNLGHTTWVNAQGGALVQAIVWRHGYLSLHPGDQAAIFVRQSSDGYVAEATTVYTEEGKLYANSYALGAHQRLSGLTAADFTDTGKIRRSLSGIREQYELGVELALAGIHAGTAPEPVLGYLLAAADPKFYRDTGQIVPASLNIFGGGSETQRPTLWTYSFDGGGAERPPAAPSATLAGLYRAMHDPDRAGVVPVAISPIHATGQSARGTISRPDFALVFDWEGVHYVYRPHSGTIGHPIPGNPVTGLPYLCVRDHGLIESIYFAATYLQGHPGERAIILPSGDPSVAFTAKNRLCLFCPSLNHFALLIRADAASIGNQRLLESSLARIRTALATPAVPAKATSQPLRRHVPENLPGDTVDLQMRRIFVAFQAAGIPIRLKDGEASSLRFTWRGVDYLYGADQQLRLASSG